MATDYATSELAADPNDRKFVSMLSGQADSLAKENRRCVGGFLKTSISEMVRREHGHVWKTS